MRAAVFIHASAEVEAGAEVGAGTKIWRFCHVMAGARIGERCMLGQGCFVADGARLGSGVRVQNHVSLYSGVDIEDDVFVGPSVVFTNVKYPRAGISRRAEYAATRVLRGATLGANATILPGVVIGEYAFVAAGAVVTRSVAPYELVAGNPARAVGFVSQAGERLSFVGGAATCPRTGQRYRLAEGRVAPDEAMPTTSNPTPERG